MCIQSLISLQNYRCEVEVSLEEDILDSDKGENSAKASLASTTCIRQTHKEEESKVHNEVINQKEEVQPSIIRYTPPQLRNNDNSESLRNKNP